MLAAFWFVMYLSWLCLKVRLVGTLFCAGTGLAFLGLGTGSLGSGPRLSAADTRAVLGHVHGRVGCEGRPGGSDGGRLGRRRDRQDAPHSLAAGGGAAWLVVSIVLLGLFLRWSAKVAGVLGDQQRPRKGLREARGGQVVLGVPTTNTCWPRNRRRHRCRSSSSPWKSWRGGPRRRQRSHH